MSATKSCNHTHADGRPCGATPMREAAFCFWHDPEKSEEATEARRLGRLTEAPGAGVQAATGASATARPGGANGLRLTAVRVVRATGGLTDVRDISAGAEHSCAARASGTAWCWGMDNPAQLGDGLYDGDPHPYAKRVVFP